MTNLGNDLPSVSTTSISAQSSPKPIAFSNDEAKRLAKLDTFGIMYSEKEAEFDRITDLVRQFIDVPVVGITFINSEHQFVKASTGLALPLLPRTMSICEHTIQSAQPLVITDTHQSELLKNHPLVVGEPFVRFYAGFPILVNNAQGEQFALGALCLGDVKPRADLSETERHVLQQFSQIISDTLQLRVEKQRATRANQIKTAFLTNMSHEIRTPMAGIVGMLESLSQTQLDEQQQGYVQHIKQANHHLLTLVNDILDLSKVEAGELYLDVKVINLKTLVQQSVSNFSAMATAQQLTLQLDYMPSLSDMLAVDGQRIEQILDKLLNNAIKFTPAGGTVTVKVGQDCINNNATTNTEQPLCIQVIDTGMGISTATQTAIFEAYDKADSYTHRMYGGVGLGLSLCKALARAMGGDLTLESEVGKGSTFCLHLPVQQAKVDYLNHQAVNHQSDNSPVATVDDLPRLTAHILLVEDNEVNAMVALKTLKKYGYTADRAKDGQEAVNLFSQSPNKYQMILMDHQMPIMDGVEATKVLRKRFSQSLPPVIAVTAHATHGDQSIYYDVGMKDCIAKPYKPELLDTVIQKWLNQSAMAS